ncbi:MAG TPA: hypothetical protein VFP35_02480 [Candidatus Saccharimonadales bacterium]|nr:hypothetical protein [Candidatus Saccharimonadales bacterium]
MDKDEARKKLEILFHDVFEENPVEKQLQKMSRLDTYSSWDQDKVLEYFEKLKEMLR